jgi:hypothetical protein
MSSKQTRKIVVEMQQNPNPRAHLALFKSNTPFKPKVVPSKLLYRRNTKHRLQQNPFGWRVFLLAL